MAAGVLVAGTFAFAVLTLLALGAVSALWRKDANEAAVARLTVIMSAYGMWFMWILCYMDQMNPLIRPIRMASKTTGVVR